MPDANYMGRCGGCLQVKPLIQKYLCKDCSPRICQPSEPPMPDAKPWTPGPWTEDYAVIRSPGRRRDVAFVEWAGLFIDEMAGNARLIAQSPALYDALGRDRLRAVQPRIADRLGTAGLVVLRDAGPDAGPPPGAPGCGTPGAGQGDPDAGRGGRRGGGVMGNTKAKRCPYCGNWHAKITGSGSEWWVGCDDCGARGPEAASGTRALMLWNTRPTHTGEGETR